MLPLHSKIMVDTERIYNARSMHGTLEHISCDNAAPEDEKQHLKCTD